MKINELIVKYRHARNLSQIDVAHKSGINLKYYQSIERGERNPRLKTLYSIAVAINIPFDMFYKDTSKEFLLFSIVSCLEKYSENELVNIYELIGAYLNEK